MTAAELALLEGRVETPGLATAAREEMPGADPDRIQPEHLLLNRHRRSLPLAQIKRKELL